MQNGLYVALSSQIALEKRLDTIADNVANASTVGFRATGVKFEDVVSGLGAKSVSFVSTGEHLSVDRARRHDADRQSVRLRHPGRCLVRHRDAWRHSHDARRPLLDDRERPTGHPSRAIRCSMPAARRSSSTRATARRRPAPTARCARTASLVAALGLFEFDPGPNFVRYGNSGIVPAPLPEPVVDRIDVGVAQGFVEESNVNPVQEMTQLIMVSVPSRTSAALMRQTENTFADAIKTLGSK